MNTMIKHKKIKHAGLTADKIITVKDPPTTWTDATDKYKNKFY